MFNTQIRFFAPLYIENDDGESNPVTGDEKVSLVEAIETRLAVYEFDTSDLSLAECLHHVSGERKAHVSGITQHVTVRGGALYACFTVVIDNMLCGGKESRYMEPIWPYLDELRRDLDGQISDGWGENFYLRFGFEAGSVVGIGDEGPGTEVSVGSVQFAEVAGLAYDAKGNPHRCVTIAFDGYPEDPYGGRLAEDGFIVGHSDSGRVKSDMYYEVWRPLAEGGDVLDSRAVYDRKMGALRARYGVSERFVRALAMHARALLGHRFDGNESVKAMEEYVGRVDR